MRLGIESATVQRDAVYVARAPFDERRVGAAAVYCSDGRFGEQMDEFLHEALRLPRYDRLAVPGGAACLAGHSYASHAKHALERQIDFLTREHGLSRIVLIAHDGCAFYRDLWLGLRTVEQQQAVDLEKAAEHVTAMQPQVRVELFFARKAEENRISFESWNAREAKGRVM